MSNFHVSGPSFEDFCKAYRTIEIPSYQRSYDWTKKEWDDLWADLDAYVEVQSEYFMGPLNAEKNPAGDGIRLADGQQRVTTLMILLASLATKAGVDSRNRIDACLFSNTASNSTGNRERLKLRLEDQTPEGRASLGVALRTPGVVTESQSRHHLASAYFLDKLEKSRVDEATANAWVNLILGKVVFARVVAQESGAGIKMFERSNNRGRALTLIDRIKSLLIATAENDFADEVVGNWTESVRALREVDRFNDMTFVAWLAAEYYSADEKILRLNEAYGEAQAAVAVEGGSLSVSRNLLGYCNALRDIRKGYIPGTKTRCGSLENAQHFGKFSQLLRLLPAARNLDSSTFVELSKQVENTICVIAIAKAFPPDIEKQMPAMLKLLRGGTSRGSNFNQVVGMLKAIRDDHSSKFGRVVYNGSYGTVRKSYLIVFWDLIEQYIENLNKSRAAQKPRQGVVLSDYTVEHILPKSPKARSASKEFGLLEAPQDRQRFANLTPLESGNNYGVKPYSEKYRVYEGSRFFLTKSMSPRLKFEGSKLLRDKRKDLLAPYKNWNHKELMKRAERLYRLATLALEFKAVAIEEETLEKFQFEGDAQLPRVHDVRNLLDGLQQFVDSGATATKTTSTLRFLGLLSESDAGEGLLDLSEDGEELLTQNRSEALDALQSLITGLPLVAVWQDLTAPEKKKLIDEEMVRIYKREKPLINKQVRECLESWAVLA